MDKRVIGDKPDENELSDPANKLESSDDKTISNASKTKEEDKTEKTSDIQKFEKDEDLKTIEADGNTEKADKPKKPSAKRRLIGSNTESGTDDDDKQKQAPKRRKSQHVDTSPQAQSNVLRTPVSERKQMQLLMQMTAPENPELSSPSNTTPKSEIKKTERRNDKGETLLHLAAIRGDINQAKKLIKLGANVNAKDNAGWTPLHEACNRGSLDVSKILIEQGADVNAHGYDNDTPLHDASMSGRPRLVKLLLKSGADSKICNKKNKLPLDVARNPKILKLLQGEDVESSSDEEKEEDKQHHQERLTLRLKQQIVSTPSSESATYRLVSSAVPSIVATFSDISDEEEDEESNQIRAVIEATTVQQSPSPPNNEEKNTEELESKITDEVKENEPMKKIAEVTTIKQEIDKHSDVKSENIEIESPVMVKSEQEEIKKELKDDEDLKVPPIKIFRENSKGNKKSNEDDVSYVVRTSGSMTPTSESISVSNQNQTSKSDKEINEERRITRSTFRSQQQKEQKDQQKDDDYDKDKIIKDEEDSNLSTTSQQIETSVPVTTVAPTISTSTMTTRKKNLNRPKTPIFYKSPYDIHNELRKERDANWMTMNLSRPKPRAPHNFQHYLSVTCDYLLDGKANREVKRPPNLPESLKKLWSDQEKERANLRMEQQVEREKLQLAMEQAVLKAHGRSSKNNAADTINVCSIIKDLDSYTSNNSNNQSQQQQQQSGNRPRGVSRRQFVQWLQDIDDIFEKKKEELIARQKHEADALYAVQQLDWPSNCNISLTRVNVSSSFSLLPT